MRLSVVVSIVVLFASTPAAAQWQRQAVCQGDCGGACGPCSRPRERERETTPRQAPALTPQQLREQAFNRRIKEIQDLARGHDAEARRAARSFQDQNPEQLQRVEQILTRFVFYSGFLALDRARYADAITELRNGLPDWPNDSVAHDWLGRALVAQGQVDEAIVEFRSALYYDKNNANAAGFLKEALELRAARPQEAEADEAARLRENQKAVAAAQAQMDRQFEHIRSSPLFRTLVTATVTAELAAGSAGREPLQVPAGPLSTAKMFSNLVFDTPTAERGGALPEVAAPPAPPLPPPAEALVAGMNEIDAQLRALQRQADAATDLQQFNDLDAKAAELAARRKAMAIDYATSFQLQLPVKQ